MENNIIKDWEEDFDNMLITITRTDYPTARVFGLDVKSNIPLKNFIADLLRQQEKVSGKRIIDEKIDMLQSFRGVMGKYNCSKDCKVSKAFYRLIEAELQTLKANKP